MTYNQGCKFSGNCLNSGLHEAQIPALLIIFSLFWRLLDEIHTLFQAFALRSAYIPVQSFEKRLAQFVQFCWKSLPPFPNAVLIHVILPEALSGRPTLIDGMERIWQMGSYRWLL